MVCHPDYSPIAKKNTMDKASEQATVPPQYMKSNLLCTLSLGLFLVCALYTIWLSVVYYFSVQELQRLQIQYVAVEQTRNALTALANDALEYSKKNPAIDPILQQFELKPKPGATNNPPQTGAKPAAK